MFHAAEKGDVDSLQRLIDTDLRHCITLVESVNQQDGLMKGTPLHTAAEEGNMKVAKVGKEEEKKESVCVCVLFSANWLHFFCLFCCCFWYTVLTYQ